VISAKSERMIFVDMYIPLSKSGRSRNGFQRDSGTIYHAVPESRVNGDNFSTALCGAVPGRTSSGWGEHKRLVVTCSKCLKKMQKLETANNV